LIRSVCLDQNGTIISSAHGESLVTLVVHSPPY